MESDLVSLLAFSLSNIPDIPGIGGYPVKLNRAWVTLTELYEFSFNFEYGFLVTHVLVDVKHCKALRESEKMTKFLFL